MLDEPVDAAAPPPAAVLATAVLATRLLGWFSGHPRIIVAFSGGADSALVLAAAARALGPARVSAVTAVSASLASGELEAARAVAEGLGVEHRTVATREIEVEGYAANSGQRCYFCKATLLDTLAAVVDDAAEGATVVTGTNADDHRAGFRPGIRAAAERGVREPLAESGLSKDQVRAVSAGWGLVTASKPAAACLSSRIAHGLRITPQRLARVDAAEAGVRRLAAAAGVPVLDLRVRDLGDRLRVEVDAPAVDGVRALAGLAPVLAEAGFDEALLAGGVDVQGFRSGSLNLLPAVRAG